MAQSLTNRVKAIKNTPGTGEFADVSEINAAFDKFDNDFRPMCKIENTAVQSIPSGGLQQLQYNGIIYDSYAARSEGPMADLSNDRIICRKSGMYTVGARIWTTTPSATGVMSLGIYVNGNGQVMEQLTPGAQQCTQSVIDDIELVNGDILIVNAIQTSGAARNYTRNTWPNGFTFWCNWKGTDTEV